MPSHVSLDKAGFFDDNMLEFGMALYVSHDGLSVGLDEFRITGYANKCADMKASNLEVPPVLCFDYVMPLSHHARQHRPSYNRISTTASRVKNSYDAATLPMVMVIVFQLKRIHFHEEIEISDSLTLMRDISRWTLK